MLKQYIIFRHSFSANDMTYLIKDIPVSYYNLTSGSLPQSSEYRSSMGVYELYQQLSIYAYNLRIKLVITLANMCIIILQHNIYDQQICSDTRPPVQFQQS